MVVGRPQMSLPLYLVPHLDSPEYLHIPQASEKTVREEGCREHGDTLPVSNPFRFTGLPQVRGHLPPHSSGCCSPLISPPCRARHTLPLEGSGYNLQCGAIAQPQTEVSLGSQVMVSQRAQGSLTPGGLAKGVEAAAALASPPPLLLATRFPRLLQGL